MNAIASRLESLLGADRVRLDADSLQHWGRDWTRAVAPAPQAVVFPGSIDEVVALVRLARETGTALVPSGGRTGLSGGAVAAHGEVVVSMDRLRGIHDFDRTDRLVRCGPGTVTAELQQFAQDQDLLYPVDFASAGSSQVGGNIATNAGGIKVIRYGLTRDWVGGLTVVTGAGEVLRVGGGLVKNATGYDLRHLFVGSEGTLGFIVEAEMKLTTSPGELAVLVLGVPRFDCIMDVLAAFRAAVEVQAFEFFADRALHHVTAHRQLARPLAGDSAFYTLIEIRQDDMDAALAAFEACVAAGWVEDGVVSQSRQQAEDLWQLREGISESLAPHTPYKNDIAVRVSVMPEFLRATNAIIAEAYPHFEVVWYGHIGDGNLHINVLRPADLAPAEFHHACHDVADRLFSVVQRFGGSVSAEHGVGLLKAPYLHYTRSPAEIAALRAIRQVFDPDGILNPGKLLA